MSSSAKRFGAYGTMTLFVRDDAGSVAALCENRDSRRSATVTFEFDQLRAMGSSRHRGGCGGSCIVSDIVPPGHAQLIVVAYPLAESYGYRYNLQYGERLQGDGAHVPELDRNDELHRPFLVGCEQPAAAYSFW